MADHSTDQTLTKREYDEIEATIAATERGRLFLHEHAQRNRTAETDVILDALSRLEPQDDNDEAAANRYQAALIEIRDAFAQAKSDLDTMRMGVIGEDGNAVSMANAAKSASAGILSAALAIQELAWTMREEGAEETVCETLDRHATAIFTGCSSHDLVSDHMQTATELVKFVDSRLVDVLGPYLPTQPDAGTDENAEIDFDASISDEAAAAEDALPAEIMGAAASSASEDDDPSSGVQHAVEPDTTLTDAVTETEAPAVLPPPPPYDPNKPVPDWNALQARGKTQLEAVENSAQEDDSDAQPFAPTENDPSAPANDPEFMDSDAESHADTSEIAADSAESAPVAPSYPPPVAPETVTAYDDLPDEPLDPRVESALAGLEDAIDAELARTQSAASTATEDTPSLEEPEPTAVTPQDESEGPADGGPVVETVEATPQPNVGSNVEPLPVAATAEASPTDAPSNDADDTEAEPDGRDTVVKASLKAVNAWSNGRKIAFFS